MCTPLFVSVDFIRTKKDLSRVLSGARRLGLLDSTKGHKHTKVKRLLHSLLKKQQEIYRFTEKLRHLITQIQVEELRKFKKAET